MFRLHRSVGRWLGFLLKDSAYGMFTDSGIEYWIEYWRVLRPNYVLWSSVHRIDYSPRNGGRIDVFRVSEFSFGRVRPIHFGPAPYNSRAVEEIERILCRQGMSEKLVTTDLVPEKFFHL